MFVLIKTAARCCESGKGSDNKRGGHDEGFKFLVLEDLIRFVGDVDEWETRFNADKVNAMVYSEPKPALCVCYTACTLPIVKE